VVNRRFVFAVPGSLDTPTGGYVYDRRVIAELPAFGWHADVIDLGSDFPRPRAQTRARAHDLLAAVPHAWPIVIDGLALGALPETAAALKTTHCVIALVHHPLALETGLSACEAGALRNSERAALAAVRHVIVPSASTARHLIVDYAVPPNRITVAPPGTDRLAPVTRSNDTVRLLSVGSLVPRKGYDVLLAALATLTDLPWRLTIAGDRTRDRDTAERIAREIASARLGDRINLIGAVAPDRLAQLYCAADVFVLASRFEGYGMAFAEAMAAGLPVIGTTAGAIPEVVPEGAGVLVPPNDAAALASALRLLLTDAEQRRALSAQARAAAENLPTWRSAAQAFVRVLEACA